MSRATPSRVPLSTMEIRVLDNTIAVLGRLTTVDDLIAEWLDDNRWGVNPLNLCVPLVANRRRWRPCFARGARPSGSGLPSDSSAEGAASTCCRHRNWLAEAPRKLISAPSGRNNRSRAIFTCSYAATNATYRVGIAVTTYERSATRSSTTTGEFGRANHRTTRAIPARTCVDQSR